MIQVLCKLGLCLLGMLGPLGPASFDTSFKSRIQQPGPPSVLMFEDPAFQDGNSDPNAALEDLSFSGPSEKTDTDSIQESEEDQEKEEEKERREEPKKPGRQPKEQEEQAVKKKDEETEDPTEENQSLQTKRSFVSRLPAADLKETAPASLQITDRASYFKIPVFDNSGTISSYLWTLSNGAHAFCANFMRTAPDTGAASALVEEVSSPELRKVLYYGFNGPGNILAGFHLSQPQQVILTGDLVSQAYSGICISKDEPGINFWSGKLEVIWNEIQSRPDPAGYRAWVAQFEGSGLNHQGLSQPFQPLAFGTLSGPPPVKPDSRPALRLIKSQKHPIFSALAPQCYSLKGAVYGLYRDEACLNQVCRMVIGEWDESPTEEVDAGTYFLKELQAPPGFALNPEVVPVEVSLDSSVENPVRILVFDQPQYAPVDLVLQKRDALSGAADAALAGAVFEIRYYGCDPKTSDPLDAKDLRAVWRMKTDEEGKIRTRSPYFVSGTDFLRIEGEAVFPVGIVTIQEISPPEGYVLNDTLFRIPIDPKGSQEQRLEAFEAPVVSERPEKIRLIKEDGKTRRLLAGAEFTLKSPSGAEKTFITNDKEPLTLSLKENGLWTLWESRAPQGYLVHPKVIQIQTAPDSIRADCPEKDASITFSSLCLRVQNFSEGWALRILKTDQTGRPLGQAVFSLQNVSKNTFEEQKTGVDGSAVFSGLDSSAGYILKETQPPSGASVLKDEQGNPIEYQIAFSRASETFNIRFQKQTIRISAGTQDPVWRMHQENGLCVLEARIVNEVPLSSLPQTGGSGVLPFFVCGSLLVKAGTDLSRIRKQNRKRPGSSREKE